MDLWSVYLTLTVTYILPPADAWTSIYKTQSFSLNPGDIIHDTGKTNKHQSLKAELKTDTQLFPSEFGIPNMVSLTNPTQQTDSQTHLPLTVVLHPSGDTINQILPNVIDTMTATSPEKDKNEHIISKTMHRKQVKTPISRWLMLKHPLFTYEKAYYNGFSSTIQTVAQSSVEIVFAGASSMVTKDYIAGDETITSSMWIKSQNNNTNEFPTHRSHLDIRPTQAINDNQLSQQMPSTTFESGIWVNDTQSWSVKSFNVTAFAEQDGGGIPIVPLHTTLLLGSAHFVNKTRQVDTVSQLSPSTIFSVISASPNTESITTEISVVVPPSTDGLPFPKSRLPIQTHNTSHKTGIRPVHKSRVSERPVKNCSLILSNTKLISQLKKAIEGKVVLIEYQIKIDDDARIFKNLRDRKESDMFKPKDWVRTVQRLGTRLLLLKPNYDVLSLKTLSINVKKFANVKLRESPFGCLNNRSYDDYETLVRQLLLNDFQNDSKSHSGQFDNVCNMHIHPDGNTADFVYYCCSRNSKGELLCEHLQKDQWLTLIEAVILIFKVIIILFCPYLVPSSIFRQKYEKKPFIFKFPLHKPYRISISLEKERTVTDIKSFQRKQAVRKCTKSTIVKLSKLKFLSSFKRAVQHLPLDENTSKVFEVDKAELMVKRNELSGIGQANVNILETFYDAALGNVESSVYACCSTDVFKFSFWKRYNNNFSLTWQQLLKRLSVIFWICLIISPWLVRMFVYYEYEEEEIELRRQVSEERGLKFYFPDSVVLFWTPLHGVFISIYILLGLEALVYGKLSKKTKEKVHYILQKCFNDMADDNAIRSLGIVVRIILVPFTTLGCLVFIGGPFMWLYIIPGVVIVFVFYLFPTANLTIQLIAHLFVYIFDWSHKFQDSSTRNSDIEMAPIGDTMPETNHSCSQDNDNKKLLNNENPSRLKVLLQKIFPEEIWLVHFFRNATSVRDHRSLRTLQGRVTQLFVIFFCLISLYSSIFLVTEILAFFMDFFIYTLIGAILYANVTMSYISLLVLLLVYAKDCFGSVAKKYKEFNITLSNYILKLSRSQTMPVFYQKSDVQDNRAFRLEPCEITSEDKCPCNQESWKEHISVSMKVIQKHLAWKITKLSLFLTSEDEPLIPNRFLMYAAEHMAYHKIPGKRLDGYMKAMYDFSLIVIFLLFVILIVITFGESYKISATNQLFATIVGGILPFMLRNFVFRQHEVDPIDTENDMKFQVAVHDLLNEFDLCLNQSWRAFDIDVIEVQEEDHKDVDQHIIVEYDEENVDWFDFPVLYQRLKSRVRKRQGRVWKLV